ncbi:MAG: Bax inhibitor-1/YccA family membrane protein, partial [Planctomycetota bacterium]
MSVGVYFVIHGKPALAPALAPLYAIVEGAFLGALTAALDGVLAQMGYAAAGGLALQAFVITISILIAMLAL